MDLHASAAAGHTHEASEPSEATGLLEVMPVKLW